MEDKISSNESEGVFNEFIDEELDKIVNEIINEGTLDDYGARGSEVIVEMDDIQVPTFTYGSPGGSGPGKGGQKPGDQAEKIRFALPFHRLMELVANQLGLPNLVKEGKGKIKEYSYEFKTFGSVGVILDKKRTFKRALKTSIGTGFYAPEEEKNEILIRRKDRRYKVPQKIEKPRYKAVVNYIGDISYSTFGERLELEKRLVNFIHYWLDYNYGADRVEHRFFVHDYEAHEVAAGDFYKVSNAGGTRASSAIELVNQITFNEYNVESTNFYAFYFGDGELFHDDTERIINILNETMRDAYNRIGFVEVKPSNLSILGKELRDRFSQDNIVRFSEIRKNSQTVHVIKKLFG